jgi:uncharacterized repeat protein (TIGR04076 family)
MERRNFIKSAAAAACCMTGLPVQNLTAKPEYENYKCKITVLRKSFNEDLYKEYPYGHASSCGRLEVGQVFVTENVWDPPQGFCTWAWGDLRSMIHSIHAGNPGPLICSCTDGLRPVLFKFERLNE